MKDLIISKELMSEVLNYEVDTFLGINKNEIDYTCCRDENEGYIDLSINLYEFAFKCKEWALSKGYTIESHTNRSFISKYNREYFSVAKIFKETDSMRINTIDESTEIEAILLACEYILNNIKQ